MFNVNPSSLAKSFISTNTLRTLKGLSERVKKKLKPLSFFNSSTVDFPRLDDPRNNGVRECLEANRFYNLPALNDDQGRRLPHKVFPSNEYEIDSNALKYDYPVAAILGSLSANKVRAIYRESERAHGIPFSYKALGSDAKSKLKEFTENAPGLDASLYFCEWF